MIEPISWSAIFSVVKAGDSIIDEQKRSQLLKKINLLIRDNRKIVVFGLSGTGKSQFINSLKKHLAIAQRTITTEKVKHAIDDFPIIFIDTPGQSARAYERKKELTDIIKNGVEGIINVTSYGYEENPDFPLENIFTSEGIVKEDFLKLNRKAEIDRLNEWLPHIEPNQIGWIINLVNKADLWWDKISEVNAHYEKEQYSKQFELIANYSHVINLPYCSIIKPYYGISTSGRFGEIQKEQMQANLMRQLLNLLKEEE